MSMPSLLTSFSEGRERVTFSAEKTVLLLVLLLASAGVRAETVVLVGLDNPIREMSQEQLARVFLRKKTDLPGGLVLEPVDQPKGSVRDAFYEHFIGMNRARISAYWAQRVFTGASKPPLQPSPEQNALSIIASSGTTIGYADSADVTDRVRVVTIKP